MTLQESVAGRPQIDLVLVDLSGFQKGGLFPPVTIPGPNDSLGDVDGRAVGRHVDHLGGKIGIPGVG